MTINNPAKREDPDDPRRDVLLEDLEFVRRLPGGGEFAVFVPAGYSTDYASVPRLLTWLCPVRGRYSRAAILHDYLCDEWRNGVARFEADMMFRSAMRELGVPWWQRVSMYYAVRLFAFFSGKDFR